MVSSYQIRCYLIIVFLFKGHLVVYENKRMNYSNCGIFLS
jgi:hypothetical protein